MTDDSGGPAFPFVTHTQDARGIPIAHIRHGMTLRDYFAAAALQAHIAAKICTGSVAAESSYRYADAMIEERDK